MKYVRLYEGFLDENKEFGGFKAAKVKVPDNKEPIENMALVHKDAGAARLNQWQKENAKTPIEVGDYVKIAFTEGKEVEWMWVNVLKVVDADHFEGRLDNDPVAVHNVKSGDNVSVERSQIAQLIKKDK